MTSFGSLDSRVLNLALSKLSDHEMSSALRTLTEVAIMSYTEPSEHTLSMVYKKHLIRNIVQIVEKLRNKN